jgi:hypothetical protein
VQSTPNLVTHLAYASGRIFVLTDLGAVAALDAYSGTVAWLDIYREQQVTPPMQVFVPPGLMGGGSLDANGPPTPWTANPVMVRDGKVFILPSDSSYIFIYDADSGAEIKRIWLSDLPPDDGDSNKPDTLLAVDDEMIYLAGPSRAWRLPWRKYDHQADKQPAGYWASVSTGSDAKSVRGRGFVTANALYLPMANAIQRILLNSGMIDPREGSFPRGGWEEGQEGPGNVLVTQDYVVVAGDRHVAVYTDLQLAQSRLNGEISAAPDDALPRLHYAEVMFAAGQIGAAQEKLDQAFNLLGGLQHLRPGKLRNRAFLDVLTFADRLSQKPDNAAANRMFDLANAAAQTSAEQVSYRLARAKFALAGNDLPSAARLYQQILLDPGMRQSPLTDPETSLTSHAGAVAEKSIDHILSTPGGAAAYEKFQLDAVAALNSAKVANDPNQLLAMAEQYPNAPQSHEALLAAARVFESQDNPRQAALVLRRVLNRPHLEQRTSVLEALARNCVKIPGQLEVAATRLSLAAAARPDDKLSKPIVLPDGSILQDITLGQARDRLNNVVARAAADALPDLHLPTGEQCAANHLEKNPFLPESPDRTIENVDKLVVPMDGFSRNSRILTWSASTGLAAYAVGSNSASWQCSAIKEPPRQAAWLDKALFVWTNGSAFLIDPESGAVRGRLDGNTLPAIDVLNDPSATVQNPNPPSDADEGFTAASPLADRVVLATTQGRICCMDSSDGHVIWQCRVSAFGVSTIPSTDDFTVVEFDEGQNMHLVVLNSFNGELVGQKVFSRDSNNYPLKLALGADGTLAYTLPDRLCLQDLYESGPDQRGMEPKFAEPATTSGTPIFLGGSGADQMTLRGGRAFVLSDQGRNVRIYSLDNGKPWPNPDAGGTDNTDAILPTLSNGSPNVTMQIAGNYLYLLSPRHLAGYEIDHPAMSWDSPAQQRRSSMENLIVGKDYLLVVDHHLPRPAENRRRELALFGYSRAAVKSHPEEESGICRYEYAVKSDATVWQPVDGGVVYFAGNAVHTLLGSRDSLPVAADRP